MSATKQLLSAGLSTALVIDDAAAQPAASLTGTYRCIQGCVPGFEGKLGEPLLNADKRDSRIAIRSTFRGELMPG
jgi:hypothetical protein